jgi:hypothetical protein
MPDVMKAVTMDPKADMEYLNMRISLPVIAWRRFDPVPARRSDIVLNRHMNNARYVETALEYLPDDFAVRSSGVEYKRLQNAAPCCIPNCRCGGRQVLYPPHGTRAVSLLPLWSFHNPSTRSARSAHQVRYICSLVTSSYLCRGIG